MKERLLIFTLFFFVSYADVDTSVPIAQTENIPVIVNGKKIPLFTIHPLEKYGGTQRQIIEANFIDNNHVDELIIYTTYLNDYDLLRQIDFTSIIYHWVQAGSDNEEKSRYIEKYSSQSISVRYKGEEILSSRDLDYDYIKLSGICTDSNGFDQVLLRMLTGGTYTGEIADNLFIYYDIKQKKFQYKIIAERYVSENCNIEDALQNEKKEKTKQKSLRQIYKNLSPSTESPDFVLYQHLKKSIPTRQLSNAEVESLFTEARQLVPNTKTKDKSIEFDENEEKDYFKDEVVFSTLSENEKWRIVAFSYRQLWSSWGVMLAQNKKTNNWTVFYSTTYSDSRTLLDLDSEVELVDDSVIGKFSFFATSKVEISLNDFKVYKKNKLKSIHMQVR